MKALEILFGCLAGKYGSSFYGKPTFSTGKAGDNGLMDQAN